MKENYPMEAVALLGLSHLGQPKPFASTKLTPIIVGLTFGLHHPKFTP